MAGTEQAIRDAQTRQELREQNRVPDFYGEKEIDKSQQTTSWKGSISESKQDFGLQHKQ